MKLHTRRTLLLIFSLLFLVSSVGAISYSQGYRLLFSPLRITTTGALYIESTQKNLTILLDNKQYKDTSGILKRGTLIDGLAPQTYTVRIEKEGFKTYEKDLVISPSQVTRLTNILLIPTHIESQSKHIFTIPSSHKLLSIQNAQRILLEKETGDWILSSSEPLAPPLNITSQIESLTKQSYDEIFFSQENKPFLILTHKKGASLLYPAQQKLTTQLEASSTPLIHNNYISSELASSSTLSLYESEEAITIPFQNIISIHTTPQGLLVYHNKDQLDLYDTNTREYYHIATTTTALPSPDKRKVLVNINNIYTLYFLQQDLEALGTQKEEFLPLPLQGNEQPLFWYDSYHLITEKEGGIYITEISQYEPLISQQIIKEPVDTLFYNQNEKTLFYTRGTQIYSLPLLLTTLQ